MLEAIINIDIELMRFINVTLANPVCDAVMPVITSEYFLRPLLVLALLLTIWKGGRYGRITAILAILTVILSDQLSSQLIKQWVGRLRPCKELDWVHLLVNCSSGKSFPSSHAVNSFGQALVWSWRYPKYRYAIFGLAFLVAISRVFVGVHYPFDVAGGAIIGIVCATAILLLHRHGLSRFRVLRDTGKAARTDVAETA
jgi:undecaprenyl-diphosphatase